MLNQTRSVKKNKQKGYCWCVSFWIFYMNIEELENYTSMVLAQATEARKRRILLKRERAKQEYIEQQRLIELETKTGKEVKQDSPSQTANSDEEVHQDKKKPKLDIPDSKTIISNVYHFLDQEYKFLQLQNENHPELRPLSAIAQRTSSATGVSATEVRSILREERMKIAEKRKVEEEERITIDNKAQRISSEKSDSVDKN